MFCKIRKILASASNVWCQKLGPRAKICVGLFLSARTWSSKVPRKVELWFFAFNTKSWRPNTKKLFNLQFSMPKVRGWMQKNCLASFGILKLRALKVQTYFQICLVNASFGFYLTLLFIYLLYRTLSKHGVHPKRYFWLLFHILFSYYAFYFSSHLILSYKFLHLKKVLSLLNNNC